MASVLLVAVTLNVIEHQGSYQCREIIFPNAPSAKGNEQYSCTVKQTTKNKRGKGVTISKQVFTDPVP